LVAGRINFERIPPRDGGVFVRGVVAFFAALVAAGLAFCGLDGACAEGATEDSAHYLFFSGFDIWRNGGFGNGGLLWSPDSLRQDGFTLKLLLGAGTYRYRGATTDITGRQYLASALPGWRFKSGPNELTVFAGLDMQQHQTSPDDPGNRLRGFHAGARGGFDLWYEPLPAAFMVTASASASTVGKNVWARAAAGLRAFDLWLGPEAIFCGDETYREWRVGAHATGLRTGPVEWTAGLGWVTNNDQRSGMYGRLGLLVRR
jgi:hypothetical protein